MLKSTVKVEKVTKEQVTLSLNGQLLTLKPGQRLDLDPMPLFLGKVARLMSVLAETNAQLLAQREICLAHLVDPRIADIVFLALNFGWNEMEDLTREYVE